MQIHHYIHQSRVNGPGNRFCLWVQGCRRRCPGCFNRETHENTRGIPMTVQAILELIRRRFPTGIDGLTVSGGEPFDQAEELGNLLRTVKQMPLHTLVYTGYPYRSIAGRYPDILREIDVLIDGPYRQSIPPRHIWAGSGNQRVLRLVEGKILYEEQNSESLFLQGEITITGDGGIITTGFIKEEQ